MRRAKDCRAVLGKSYPDQWEVPEIKLPIIGILLCAAIDWFFYPPALIDWEKLRGSKAWHECIRGQSVSAVSQLSSLQYL